MLPSSFKHQALSKQMDGKKQRNTGILCERFMYYVVFLVIGHGATSPMFFALTNKKLLTASAQAICQQPSRPWYAYFNFV